MSHASVFNPPSTIETSVLRPRPRSDHSSTSSATAVAQLASDESILRTTNLTTPVLPPPSQNGSGVKTKRRKRVATPIPSSITPTKTHDIAAALLREEDEDLPEVRLFRDKEGIDDKSKDTFAPFLDNSKENSMYLIDLIHIDGTPTEVAEI